jgi:hypothetical protein
VALFPKVQAALTYKIVEESFILFAGPPGIACKCHVPGRQRTADGRCHRFQYPAPVDRLSSVLPSHPILSLTLTPAREAKAHRGKRLRSLQGMTLPALYNPWGSKIIQTGTIH